MACNRFTSNCPKCTLAHQWPACRTQGFTLVEVLVALFIVSLTLISGLKAAQTLSLSVQRQETELLAQWCVNNHLSALRLSSTLPSTGATQIPCEQASHAFSLHSQVDLTPNPSFRRVQVQVFDQSSPILSVTTIVGTM